MRPIYSGERDELCSVSSGDAPPHRDRWLEVPTVRKGRRETLTAATAPVVEFSAGIGYPQRVRPIDDGLRSVELARVELRHFRYYIAVAEEQSIAAAARRLYMAAPPLSVQMRRLEAEVGTPLLIIRGRQRISLTEAGEVFLQRARQALAHVHGSIALVRQVAKNQGGHLTVGYNAVAEFGVLPNMVRKFREAVPSARFALRALRTPDQVQALIRHEIDVGFVCLPVATDGYEITELASQPFVVVLPIGHRLAAQRRVSFHDLSSEPLILYSRNLDPNSFREIEDRFSGADALMNVVYEMDSSLSMVQFAADGHGCCIAPEYVHTFVPAAAVCRPLGPPTIMRTLAVCMRNGAGKLPQAFYRFVVEHWCR
jgi:DNA-binding transcriptional LysR family regulator